MFSKISKIENGVGNKQSNKEYYNETYLEMGKGGFIRCWHQIDEVLKTKPKNVLEIGIGNGFVSNYLKSRKINLTTFDIDEKLNPDATGDITNLRNYFSKESFDVILCAEVLEHLPFKLFESILKEIYEVSKKNVIITLPHHALQSYFHIKIHLLPPMSFTTRIPFPFKYKWKIGGAHYWEIGWKGYPLGRIKKEISKYFKIKKFYAVPESLFHWVFILEKKSIKLKK